jgi:hypothetical protein
MNDRYGEIKIAPIKEAKSSEMPDKSSISLEKRPLIWYNVFERKQTRKGGLYG